MDDSTLEDMDEKARSLLYGEGLDEDAVEDAMTRLHLVLSDAVGDRCSGSSRPTVDRVLKGIVDEMALQGGYLCGYAAIAAARELLASWMDVVAEGDERNLTRMMVSDIDEVATILCQWKSLLQDPEATSSRHAARKAT